MCRRKRTEDGLRSPSENLARNADLAVLAQIRRFRPKRLNMRGFAVLRERGLALPALDEDEAPRLLDVAVQVVLQRARLLSRRLDVGFQHLPEFLFLARLGDE